MHYNQEDNLSKIAREFVAFQRQVLLDYVMLQTNFVQVEKLLQAAYHHFKLYVVFLCFYYIFSFFCFLD